VRGDGVNDAPALARADAGPRTADRALYEAKTAGRDRAGIRAA